jgi:hypothetical protein
MGEAKRRKQFLAKGGVISPSHDAIIINKNDSLDLLPPHILETWLALGSDRLDPSIDIVRLVKGKAETYAIAGYQVDSERPRLFVQLAIPRESFEFLPGLRQTDINTFCRILTRKKLSTLLDASSSRHSV